MKTPPLRVAGLLLMSVLLSSLAGAEAGANPAAALEKAISAAENSLREGEPQAAESRYRTALLEGWLLMGELAALEGRMPEALEAYRAASTSAVDDRRALQSLALHHLQMGDAAASVEILTRLTRRNPRDIVVRRMFGQALMGAGNAERAVRELEEARALAPADLELTFALAGAYLGLGKVDLAAGLFSEIVRERPIPQTHVLIGRTYRDFGELERARAELRAALKQDPRVRRAHYYLGMVTLKEAGRAGMDEAIEEFKAELETAPQDPLANLELGVALVQSQRHAEALPALEIAAHAQPADPRTLSYLGRAQLGAERPADAAASLKRALELARARGANAHALRGIHLQLGQALRRLGQTEEAAPHFAESQRLSAEGTEAEREQLARYLADASDPEAAKSPFLPAIEVSPLTALPPSQRLALKSRVTAALARIYLNLGVMQAQGERFGRAAELFEKAADIDPGFPQVQSSLGVAYFNARQFDKATGALTRALAAGSSDPGLKRMLALAWLNTQNYEKAAELLRDDPQQGTDPSLQFAYGLSLVKSDHAAEAERIFSGLLARHGDSPELSVLLGQAHAQQGDYGSAIASLQRALRLKADVAEANATLGVIYLRQGRMAEAEQALRAALASHPADLQSHLNLAIVLDSEQRPEEALPLLRSVLKAKPDFADARYLVGKILLGQGAAAEAVEHLEAAARLAPEDANIHYQLGKAYQRLGRTDRAEQEFEVFRKLKAKR